MKIVGQGVGQECGVGEGSREEISFLDQICVRDRSHSSGSLEHTRPFDHELFYF